MNIKPQNVLVKVVPVSTRLYQVYLVDFGLSRSFTEQGSSQTDGPTARTPRYCAPEVYASEARGCASDIFSLDCAYTEMLTVYGGKDLDDFVDYRSGDGEDDAFHTNLDKVSSWIAKLNAQGSQVPKSVRDLVSSMISYEPAKRPTASQMVDFFHSLHMSPFKPVRDCCNSSPEPYVAYRGQLLRSKQN